MKAARYNPPQQMIFRARLLVAAAVLAFLVSGAHAADWEQPATKLARQIAELTGPGPVQMSVQNRSNLSPAEVPAIRQLLEQDLRGFGVIPGDSGNATFIRITLSQNLQGGLWVAEVKEGTETRVTMLSVSLEDAGESSGRPDLALTHSVLVEEPGPILDAQIVSAPVGQWLIVLEPAQILVLTRSANFPVPGGAPTAGLWSQTQSFPVTNDRAVPRDMRGRVVAAQDHLFDAYLPGMECRGTNDAAQVVITCADSDDPWPVTTTQKAFYNSARDYFTGLLAPGFGMQLAPFYEAAEIARAGEPATLLNEVDGPPVLVESNQIEPVNGADDWGSDLAVIHSACGSGTQVVVSGSGAAIGGDSLRAYQITGREAVPVSAPLQVAGTVMAIWPASDGNHATVIVRQKDSRGHEVWNVTASCD